ncbi:MAG: tRNA (adenosine(37)-N6)-dimethylallyltransferase MiaA [Lachnospiraceae bacterium]|nr:tRNA (adenosine(37)-N6)-dimethylallyltransferase MiaA [Lachnospiraceae bacterium]
MKKPLVILTGPTAVGKTALSIRLAKAIGGEIISADSMQVYKGMDIGSAKISHEEMDGVCHHLIDILSPEEEFNVMIFQQKCKEAMERIYKAGHIPILTGGTGFYIQAVLYDIDFSKEEESGIRSRLEEISKQKDGPRILHEMLQKVDPKSAEAIHLNNVKRVIRAIEFYELTGTRISDHNEEEKQKEAAYNSAYFVLNDERELLYRRIDQRVDEMFANGLVEEVSRLKDFGYHRQMVSMQGLGYKEVLDYLDGHISLEEAIYLIKRDTRHFAKRQLTWFRREKDVVWVDMPKFQYQEDLILNYMLDVLKERGII